MPVRRVRACLRHDGRGHGNRKHGPVRRCASKSPEAKAQARRALVESERDYVLQYQWNPRISAKKINTEKVE